MAQVYLDFINQCRKENCDFQIHMVDGNSLNITPKDIVLADESAGFVFIHTARTVCYGGVADEKIDNQHLINKNSIVRITGRSRVKL